LGSGGAIPSVRGGGGAAMVRSKFNLKKGGRGRGGGGSGRGGGVSGRGGGSVSSSPAGVMQPAAESGGPSLGTPRNAKVILWNATAGKWPAKMFDLVRGTLLQLEWEGFCLASIASPWTVEMTSAPMLDITYQLFKPDGPSEYDGKLLVVRPSGKHVSAGVLRRLAARYEILLPRTADEK
jgi:hypothetical protein